MVYKVYRSVLFDKKVELFSDEFKKQMSGFEDQLAENPYVGKPLGFKWFREKKADKFRMYYLIYEDLRAVYILTLSEKKDQQKTINTIKMFLEQYRYEIEQLLSR
ncbi:MAG: hypothetical protein Q7R76_04245 [Candidatus Woesearchaeota archaeon]|nr:hypothetical protein [Candidatus Woesearchaeota archaeon]